MDRGKPDGYPFPTYALRLLALSLIQNEPKAQTNRTSGANSSNLRCKIIVPQVQIYRTLGAKSEGLRFKSGRPKALFDKPYILIAQA